MTIQIIIISRCGISEEDVGNKEMQKENCGDDGSVPRGTGTKQNKKAIIGRRRMSKIDSQNEGILAKKSWEMRELC